MDYLFLQSQQYLPFTVLKRVEVAGQSYVGQGWSQQYLPFTVLKRCSNIVSVATDIRSQQYLPFTVLKLSNAAFTLRFFTFCRNSAYRLRY